MVLKPSLLLACAFALTATASPCKPVVKTTDATTSTLTADKITSIAPATSSCSGADFPAECANATRAAASINTSFTKYGISTPGEQAALLALMLYESGNFKYNKNHWPGVPGQGTRNMQSPAFNLKYASSLFDAATVSQAQAKGLGAVLALVSKDEESFGSAAWFLSTQCGADVKQGLAAGTSAGWSAYLTQCVGTTDTADRDAIWSAAVKALGAGQ